MKVPKNVLFCFFKNSFGLYIRSSLSLCNELSLFVMSTEDSKKEKNKILFPYFSYKYTSTCYGVLGFTRYCRSLLSRWTLLDGKTLFQMCIQVL